MIPLHGMYLLKLGNFWIVFSKFILLSKLFFQNKYLSVDVMIIQINMTSQTMNQYACKILLSDIYPRALLMHFGSHVSKIWVFEFGPIYKNILVAKYFRFYWSKITITKYLFKKFLSSQGHEFSNNMDSCPIPSKKFSLGWNTSSNTFFDNVFSQDCLVFYSISGL